MDSIVETDMQYIAQQISHTKCEGKTFLITGATGFIGSYFVSCLMYMNEHYLKEKCRVVAMCRNEKKACERFRNYLENPYFFVLIQDIVESVHCKWNIDYIIHAASSATTDSFRKIPAEVLQANIIGTYNLLEYARHKMIEGMLFLSSGAVYGEIPQSVKIVTEEDVFSANFLQEKNSYLVGKRAGEALCRAYYCQYDVPAKIVRISHTYGPGIDLNDGRVFSDFIKSIVNYEALQIKGTGQDMRPFCYIRDAMEAFFMILFEGMSGEAYNMENIDAEVTISDLADILVHEAFPERKLAVRYLNSMQGNSAIAKPKEDITKLKQLGWIPKVGIIEGFRRTVKSFEEAAR